MCLCVCVCIFCVYIWFIIIYCLGCKGICPLLKMHSNIIFYVGVICSAEWFSSFFFICETKIQIKSYSLSRNRKSTSLFIIIIFCNEGHYITSQQIVELISTFLIRPFIHILYSLATIHLQYVMKDSAAVSTKTKVCDHSSHWRRSGCCAQRLSKVTKETTVKINMIIKRRWGLKAWEISWPVFIFISWSYSGHSTLKIYWRVLWKQVWNVEKLDRVTFHTHKTHDTRISDFLYRTYNIIHTVTASLSPRWQKQLNSRQ